MKYKPSPALESRVKSPIGSVDLDWQCECGRRYTLSIDQVATFEPQHTRRVVLPEANPLTEFQTAVLEFVASGMTDAQVARVLGVSVHRERHAMRELLTRLSAHSRAEAVFVATSWGLVASDRSRFNRPFGKSSSSHE